MTFEEQSQSQWRLTKGRGREERPGKEKSICRGPGVKDFTSFEDLSKLSQRRPGQHHTWGLMPILTSFDLSRSNQQLYRVSRRQCHDRIYLPRASEQARSGFAHPVRSSVQPAPAVSGFLRRRLSAKPAARTAAGVGSPRRRGAGAVGAGHLGDLKRDRVGALGALASAEAASGSRRRA